MTFHVAEECVQLGLRAGAIVFRDLRIAPAPPELRAEIDREIQTIRGRFADPAAVRSCPEVAAWVRLPVCQRPAPPWQAANLLQNKDLTGQFAICLGHRLTISVQSSERELTVGLGLSPSRSPYAVVAYQRRLFGADSAEVSTSNPSK